jgi:hypothetical protein
MTSPYAFSSPENIRTEKRILTMSFTKEYSIDSSKRYVHSLPTQQLFSRTSRISSRWLRHQRTFSSRTQRNPATATSPLPILKQLSPSTPPSKRTRVPFSKPSTSFSYVELSGPRGRTQRSLRRRTFTLLILRRIPLPQWTFSRILHPFLLNGCLR